MATTEDRGLALWRAVLEASRRCPHSDDDVMAVGDAGDEVVVIRVHFIDKKLLNNCSQEGGTQ